MAIRVRTDGTMVCAAMSEEEDGDTYIDDAVQEYLGAARGDASANVIIADDDHDANGLWHWKIHHVQHNENHKEELLARVRRAIDSIDDFVDSAKLCDHEWESVDGPNLKSNGYLVCFKCDTLKSPEEKT